jgi:hypothetical protein
VQALEFKRVMVLFCKVHVGLVLCIMCLGNTASDLQLPPHYHMRIAVMKDLLRLRRGSTADKRTMLHSRSFGDGPRQSLCRHN